MWLQERLSRRFRAFLCGSADGVPPWLDQVARGNEAGFFDPDGAPWVIHSDFATLVGGVRALLLQALHPGSLAGVRSHSRYKEDPLGRLAGTIQWLTVTTFASITEVEAEAARVLKMHERVKGEYTNARNETVAYHAGDADLLCWVHIAFMDSFLRSHQHFSSRPIPGGADDYVRLWAKSVELLGLNDVPRTDHALMEKIQAYEPELVINAQTREVLQWLRNPPLPFVARVVYVLLFQAALASLPLKMRDMIGGHFVPLGLAKLLIKALFILMKMLLGNRSPIEEAALARLARIK